MFEPERPLFVLAPINFVRRDNYYSIFGHGGQWAWLPMLMGLPKAKRRLDI